MDNLLKTLKPLAYSYLIIAAIIFGYRYYDDIREPSFEETEDLFEQGSVFDNEGLKDAIEYKQSERRKSLALGLGIPAFLAIGIIAFSKQKPD